MNRNEPVDQKCALTIADQLCGDLVADRLLTNEACLAHVLMTLSLLGVKIIQDCILIVPLVVLNFIICLSKNRCWQLRSFGRILFELRLILLVTFMNECLNYGRLELLKVLGLHLQARIIKYLLKLFVTLFDDFRN